MSAPLLPPFHQALADMALAALAERTTPAVPPPDAPAPSTDAETNDNDEVSIGAAQQRIGPDTSMGNSPPSFIKRGSTRVSRVMNGDRTATMLEWRANG